MNLGILIELAQIGVVSALAVVPLALGFFLLFSPGERLLEKYSAAVYNTLGHPGDYYRENNGRRTLLMMRAAGALTLAVGALVCSYIIGQYV